VRGPAPGPPDRVAPGRAGSARRVAMAVMAKVPAPGDVKTRLCPPLTPVQAAGLARCFLQDRVEQLGEIEVAEPMVAFTPAEREPEMRELLPPPVRLVPQRGADLGARLDGLLTQLLAEGYPGAIAVDADSPTLPTAFLREACTRLLDHTADVVVGPCEDGGYYLVGLRAPTPALFRDVPWSTPGVLDATVARARRLGVRLALLPPWFDVDRAGDLTRLRASPGGAPVTPRAAVSGSARLGWRGPSPAPASGAPYHPRRTLAFLDAEDR
jgi:rSAM/selenodomain-associated transferase 1